MTLPILMCKRGGLARASARRRTAAILFAAVLICFCPMLFSGCVSSRKTPLPDGGYDFRVAGGVMLGYPIPITGENPMCLPAVNLDSDTESGKSGGAHPAAAAYRYDDHAGAYRKCDVSDMTLLLPDKRIGVLYTLDADGNALFFACETTDGVRIAEGAVENRAVVTDGMHLYLADADGYFLLTDRLGTLFAVSSDQNRVLFSSSDRRFYEYRAGDVYEFCVDPVSVSDAWYAVTPDGNGNAVVFKEADTGIWYFCAQDGTNQACRMPEGVSACVLLRGSAFALSGDDGSCFLSDLLSGERIDMDMGGLFRFPKDRKETVNLPLSPDGSCVYFYDTDFIYRLNLLSGTLDLADNEAPLIGNNCILHSVTPVTNEIVLLSQAAAEYNEYLPTLTEAVFREDVPEVRHEDVKIDLD